MLYSLLYLLSSCALLAGAQMVRSHPSHPDKPEDGDAPIELPNATKAITLPPTGGEHTSTLIFFHAMDHSASDYVDFVKDKLLPDLPNTKAILPQAPDRWVSWHETTTTKPRKMKGPAWWDFVHIRHGTSKKHEHDVEEIDGQTSVLLVSSSTFFLAFVACL